MIDEATGRPLAGVHVTAGDEARDFPTLVMVLGGEESDRSPMAGGEAVSDADGRFEIGGLRANPHALFWALDGYDMPVESLPHVRPGEGDVLLKMRLRPRLTGRAVDEAGAPIADLVVNGRDPGTEGTKGAPRSREAPLFVSVRPERSGRAAAAESKGVT